MTKTQLEAILPKTSKRTAFFPPSGSAQPLSHDPPAKGKFLNSHFLTTCQPDSSSQIIWQPEGDSQRIRDEGMPST
jgi:hypothetical protein